MSSAYTPWASSPAARRVMQGNRGRDSTPEIALRRAVHALGLRYRVDARPLSDINRRADLVFARAKVAVFVDGCYWHGCPDHGTQPRTNADYWTSKIGRNVERDKHTDSLLIEAGWLPIRIWEHEELAAAARRVAEVVHSRTEASPSIR